MKEAVKSCAFGTTCLYYISKLKSVELGKQTHVWAQLSQKRKNQKVKGNKILTFHPKMLATNSIISPFIPFENHRNILPMSLPIFRSALSEYDTHMCIRVKDQSYLHVKPCGQS